jgi:hypothetical protein
LTCNFLVTVVTHAAHLFIFFSTFRSIIQSSIYPKSKVSHQHLIEQLRKQRNFKRVFLKQRATITNREFFILITTVKTFGQTYFFKENNQGCILWEALWFQRHYQDMKRKIFSDWVQLGKKVQWWRKIYANRMFNLWTYAINWSFENSLQHKIPGMPMENYTVKLAIHVPTEATSVILWKPQLYTYITNIN